ncbi:hypothetical protein Nos7524_3723 [Nostoc sp. PCC 7524]|nr:hypothetical protein Nos7524_3723 [Nostoc sp. PCC 7524]
MQINPPEDFDLANDGFIGMWRDTTAWGRSIRE